ncbi:hypothetical protein P4T34_09880 [Bacillus mobilis]|nr:hypothetical protein [Bacillus mobilis]MED0950684.1 hypothetical protein [Bacillus mobilis]MED0995789.1 hypothetical protein [Bacillus mobilis]MED1000864.1 hypothetical protein [Bacillus mobilis]
MLIGEGSAESILLVWIDLFLYVVYREVNDQGFNIEENENLGRGYEIQFG